MSDKVARAAILLVAVIFAGCASPGPTPEATTAVPIPNEPSPTTQVDSDSLLGLGIWNETSVPVTLAVNGQIIETVPAQGPEHTIVAPLPSMPWTIEARSPSGRVLTQLDVEQAQINRVAWVVLSCGEIILWYGQATSGGPSFALPKASGDCD